MDCLKLSHHISHFGLEDAVVTGRRIGAQRTYLTGFGHEATHEEWVTITEAIGAAENDEADLTEMERKGVEMVRGGTELWVRPAHDGLRVFVEGETVRDETY